MLDFLNMVGVGLFVLFFFGFCVFIHELGHFLVAKWCGLHINAFSIGFKKVWGKTINGVEYRIGCLPFGGYVDLPQVDATGSEIKDQDGNPLPAAKPIHRILTAVAGPLFNFIFGFFLAAIIWYYGVPQPSPKMKQITVGSIQQESAAFKTGLREGDVIIKLNGKPLNGTWHQFINDFIMTIGKVKLTVKDGDKTKEIVYQAEVNPENKVSVDENIFYPRFTPNLPVVVFPQPDSPAKQAGVQPGDIITKINGKEVKSKMDLIEEGIAYSPKEIQLIVKREGKAVEIPSFKTAPINGYPKSYKVGVTLKTGEVVLDKIAENSKLYKLGLRNGDLVMKINNKVADSLHTVEQVIKDNSELSLTILRGNKTLNFDKIKLADKETKTAEEFTFNFKNAILIDEVKDGLPADKAGIKIGDRIKSVNGISVMSANEFIDEITKSKGTEVKVTILRGDEEKTLKVTPELTQPHGLGLELTYIAHPTPWEQFSNVITNSFRTLKGVFAGIKNKAGISKEKSSLKLRNFSGPIGIIDIISKVVYNGSYLQGLNIIVMITFSLGLLNLFPLPVLDGGHIVMAMIQIIIRRPLPAKLVEPLTMLFVVLLISFMLYVTAFDIKRVYNNRTATQTTDTTQTLSCKIKVN